MDPGGTSRIYSARRGDETDRTKYWLKHILLRARGGFGYPVRQEKLPLGSEEVGQVPVLAVFHHHHERTWRSRRFHERWRCSARWQAQSSARPRSPLGLVQAPTRFTTFR